MEEETDNGNQRGKNYYCLITPNYTLLSVFRAESALKKFESKAYF